MGTTMFVLFLHGPAAAGKHTIGSLLADALQLPLFHNHLTVDLARCLFEFGSAEFNELRGKVWDESFSLAARANRSFIFTFHPERSVEPSLIAKLAAVVEESGGQVHYIELVCAEDALLERLDTPQRARFGKLRDSRLYRQLNDSGAFDFPPLPTPLIRVDTGTLEPPQAAQQILEALEERAGICHKT